MPLLRLANKIEGVIKMSLGNKVIGTTTVKLGIYDEDDDSQLIGSLGQRKVLEDGREFVLCYSGGALTAGILVQAPAPDAADDELVVNTAAAAGDKEVEITVTAGHGGYDASALQEGYLMVTKGTNCIGTFYKIKDNDAMVASESATITLYDPLTYAIAVNDEVCVVRNPYKDVVTGSTTAPVIGVPLQAVSDNHYFWALCKGVGPGVDSGSGVAAGDDLTHVGGDVITQDGTEDKSIGTAFNTAAANEGVIVNYTGLC